MKNAIIATLALGSAALTSCMYDPYYGQPAGGLPVYRPEPGGYGGGAYQDGLRDGARDARNGRSYNPRGQYSLPQHLRDEYRSGYNAGYRRSDGGGWHGDGPGEARFFQEGVSDAQRDRRNGRSYNPSRHWDNVPPRARDEFNRGYAAGWSRRY